MIKMSNNLNIFLLNKNIHDHISRRPEVHYILNLHKKQNSKKYNPKCIY